MLDAGCGEKEVPIPTTFIMNDTQIMYESFLEDINNILNTGEITNIYEEEHFKRMSNELTKVLERKKLPTSLEYIYQEYIDRLRDNFHIILCMSPVGENLRIRCRKFPSLVNCCTLDWYDNWPEQALNSVSKEYFQVLENVEDKIKNDLSEIFSNIHRSVELAADRYYSELRRKTYVTPKSFLDCIQGYLDNLFKRRDEHRIVYGRLQSGI